MKFKFHYANTYADILESFRAIRIRTRPWAWISLAIISILVTISAIAASFRRSSSPAISDRPMHIDALLTHDGLYLAVFSSFILLTIWAYLNRIRRYWKSDPGLAEPRSITLIDAELTESERRYSITLPWSSMTGWKETPNVIILQTTLQSMLMIPKRSIPSEDLELLRVFLHDKFPTHTNAFPLTSPTSSTNP